MQGWIVATCDFYANYQIPFVQPQRSKLYISLVFIDHEHISRSRRVNEIRSLISKKLDLTAVQSLNPMIPISPQALTVLHSEEQILHQGTTKLEQD